MGLLPPLVERRLLGQDGILLEVRGQLPFVVRVRFGDVDEREVRPVTKALDRGSRRRPTGDETAVR